MFTLDSPKVQTFDFKIGEKVYSVPMANYLPYDLVRNIPTDRTEVYAVSDWMLAEIFERYAPGCTEGLTVAQITELLTAYDKACQLGE